MESSRSSTTSGNPADAARDGLSSSLPKSMTGFARVVVTIDACELEIELKSVNHRFLEVAVKLPRIYNEFERSIRAMLQRDHRRGRLDVAVQRRAIAATSVVCEDSGSSQFESALDSAVARFGSACKRYGVSGDHLGAFLVQAVISYRTSDEDVRVDVSTEEEGLLKAVQAASKLLLEMREKEGTHLVEEISQRMRTVEGFRILIQEIAADLPQRAQKRLTERVQQLMQEVQLDAGRIALEVALIAERSDITEELTRLDSHFQQFRATLQGTSEGIGRKLDFLMQEFGREFNTITSKSQDARIQGIVVDAKAELEKIREQIQNIE